MNTVILAEKPSQAQSYAEAFKQSKKKNGYFEVSDDELPSAIITYGYGHLVSLAEPEQYNKDWKKWSLGQLPMFPDQYKFEVSKGAAKQFNIVKKHLDNADTIIIGTDSDREGENIARSIINLSGNGKKDIKRLWLNSLETDEIRKGLKNLKDGKQFYSTYKEAQTRQIADWLVGMNLSRLYTLYMQNNGLNGVFSIGRVQTPTLFMIYQRNQEIENFISKPFYELYGTFYTEKGEYEGKYSGRFDTEDEVNDFLRENNIDSISKLNRAKVKNVDVKEKRQQAPRLFSLSDLQATANKRFKYSASKTLSVAQALYDKKVLSYPRTDTNYIGSPEFNYLKDNLNSYLNLANAEIKTPQLEENVRFVNGKKVQEHYAIIPTKTLPELEKLTKDEKNIYLLVLLRTLAIFETPYIYEETKIETLINDVLFKTTGKVEIDKGWKRLYKNDSKKEKQEKELPKVSVGDQYNSSITKKEGKTQPPKYYTQGTIITAMKNVGRSVEDEENKEILNEAEGIGTEATRANILDTLKRQEYITIKSNNIYVTDKGKTLCEVVKEDEISDVNMTAQWERYLKKIKNNQGTQEAFLGSIERFIEHLIEKVPKTFSNSNIKEHAKTIQAEKIIGKCSKCGESIVDKGKFYGCTGFKDKGCKFSLPKKWSKKTIPKTNIKQLIEKGETTEIKGFKSKKGHKFSAKLKLEGAKLQFVFDN